MGHHGVHAGLDDHDARLGKAGDLFGRKPMMLVVIILFMAGSLVGALAPTMPWLIAARTIQGLGGGGLMILSQASVADFVPARERGKYAGFMGGVFAVSSVAGPLLGGWLTEGPGWRWVFWIVMPLALLAMLAIVTLMPSVHRAAAQRPKIDTAGTVLMSLATTAIILAASWGGHTYDWLSPQILALLVGALVLAAIFVRAESRADHPVIPLSLFKNRNFVLTTIAGLATAVAMFGVVGYLPTYFQMAEGVSATEAGLLMVPLMGSLLLTSVVLGAVVSKTGRYKAIPIIGSILLALGLWQLSTISLDPPWQ